MHFVRSYHIGILQCTVQKKLNQNVLKIRTVVEHMLTKCNLEEGL